MSDACTHSTPYIVAGVATCPDCGEELTLQECEKIKLDPSFISKIRDSAPVPDTGKKIEETGIYKEVTGYGFDNRVAEIANDIFLRVTKDTQTIRSRNRKGVMFACVFYAFQEIGEPRECSSITSVMNITDNSVALNGLKTITISGRYKRSPTSVPLTVETFVDKILDKLKATKKDVENVKAFYTGKIKGNSVLLDRAKPQSVAAGVVYYWLTKQCKHSISPQDYNKVAEASTLTISRITKEIGDILSWQKPRLTA